jgi:hypothetical protein
MAISEHTSSQSPDTQLPAPTDPSPQPTFESRQLTLGEYTLPDRWDPHDDPDPAAHSRPTSAPYLRLAGKWLEKAGFTAGAKVRVDVSQGRLVIEPVPQFPDLTPRLPRRGKKVLP